MLCFFAQFHSSKMVVVYSPYSNKAEGSQKKKILVEIINNQVYLTEKNRNNFARSNIQPHRIVSTYH